MCGRHFPGNCRHLSPHRGVHGVVNLGGVVKTLRRSNSLSRTVFSTAGSFGQIVEPLFCGSEKIPQNSRQISRKVSLPKIKTNSPTSFCRGAGKTIFLGVAHMFSSQRRVHYSAVNLGGVVKTLRRSDSLSRAQRARRGISMPRGKNFLAVPKTLQIFPERRKLTN